MTEEDAAQLIAEVSHGMRIIADALAEFADRMVDVEEIDDEDYQ